MNQETIDKLRRLYKESTNALAKEGAKKKLQDAGISLTADEPKSDKPKMDQETIDKLRRLYNESTNALAKEGAKKKLQDAGISLTAEKPKSEKPKKTKKEPSKAEPKSEPAKTGKTKDEYDCDDLIAKAKERKAKAKATAIKRANAPKKTPSTKNKEAIAKTSEKVEKSIVSRAKKGEVKVAELEKLISEYEDAIKKLKTLLSKVKSGKKFAQGGNMGMMDSEHAKEYHEIKEHHCGCNDKKMAKGGDIENGSNAIYLGSISTEKKNQILQNIAKHYGISIQEAENEVIDKDAENIYEYIANDTALKTSVYNEFKKTNSLMARGGGVKARRRNPNARNPEIDNDYSALKEGKRTSRKYANVEIRGGGVYHRRNANQYGKVKGGKTYYEHHDNRTDAKRYFESGGSISKKDSLLNFVSTEMSSGMISTKCEYSDYKTLDKIKSKMISILNKEGDRKYSISETSKLVKQAVKELGL